MTYSLPQQVAESVTDIQRELERAEWRPDSALRRAVAHAEQLAPAIIDLVEMAADGVCLLPKQENLLFWGIHVLGAARCTVLYRPLLRLIALDRDEYLDPLIGDAATDTLPRILISVFDGDAAPLFELCAQSTLDGFLRWGLFDAIARLTFDGAIPRPTTVEFLDRFERENMAVPGDAAWEGWQDAIALLGVEELYERVRETWRDERSPCEPGDQEVVERWFAEARALPPGDPTMFVAHGREPINDPAAALRWMAAETREKPRKASSGADPAAGVALTSREAGWLRRFLVSAKVSTSAMTLEQLDGFFCALIAGPTAPPSEYMPVIWDPGDDPDPDCAPSYDNVEQQEFVRELLTRHWKTIAARLDRGYPHEPLLEGGPDELDAQFWAAGFIRGVAMRAQVWGTRSSDEFVAAFLKMMITLGAGEKVLAEDGFEFDMRQAIVDGLPIQLVRIHHLWHGRPDPFPPPAATHFEGRKVGRNEPCPCGSGKKFKRCCGSSGGSNNWRL